MTTVSQEQRNNFIDAATRIGVSRDEAVKMSKLLTLDDIPKYQTLEALEGLGVNVDNLGVKK